MRTDEIIFICLSVVVVAAHLVFFAPWRFTEEDEEELVVVGRKKKQEEKEKLDKE